MTAPLLHDLAEVYRTPGLYAAVYSDQSVDTGDPPQVAEERRRSIADTLSRAGAPQPDVDAIVDALTAADQLPSPVTAFAVARAGELVIDQLLPTRPLDHEFATYGPLPDLAPLLKHALDAFTYLVVETAREGGRVSVHHVGRPAPEDEAAIEGRTDTLHKPKSSGGWRHDYNQHHAEEIWRQNQAELADAVDDLVRRHRPRLLVVTGDIRARQLLEDALSTEARAIVRVLPSDQAAEGSDPERLAAFIEEEVDRIIREDEAAVAAVIAEHEGRGDNRSELTLGGIVHALAAAQVETLLIDEERLGDRELLALDAPPWVASAPEEALTASVIASVPARLALVRAALATDAQVFFARQEGTEDAPLRLPEDSAVAALLRWPTGPPVPGI